MGSLRQINKVDLQGSISASLRNYKGKGVERTNDGSPAKWRLAG
jgi:hypothetical protein